VLGINKVIIKFTVITNKRVLISQMYELGENNSFFFLFYLLQFYIRIPSSMISLTYFFC
jgi:hypothetical protein